VTLADAQTQAIRSMRVRQRRGERTAMWLAAGVIAVASILRVWSLLTPAAQIDGDQAVTGLMVDDMLSGRRQYIFIAGQRYNGALEQWVQAAIYRGLRLPRNPFTLRLPEVAWMAVAGWLVFLIGRRVCASSWRAVVATALFAVGSYWTLWKGNHSDGAYPSLLVVALLALYCALRMADDDRNRLWWSAALGFFAGMVVWLGQSGAELLVPAALWVAPIYARSLRPWLTALPAAALGAAPTLLWSARHGIFAPLDTGLNTVPSTLAQRFDHLAGPILKEFLGIAGESGRPGWPYWLQSTAVVAVTIGYVVAVARRRRGIASVLLLRPDSRSPVDALLVSVPIVAALYVASPDAWGIIDPHYLFTYTPTLAWCLAAALPGRPAPLRAATTIALTATTIATALVMLVNRSSTYLGGSDIDLRAAVSYLQAQGERDVYADFWTALPLQYYARTTLNIAPIGAGRGKFPATTAAVARATHAVYVSSPRSGRTGKTPDIRAKLLARHVHFTEHTLGDVTIYDNLRPAVKPWQVGLGPRPPT
jgi:hypothetical protein